MCQEVVQQCCHCGDNIGIYINPCHSWYVDAQVANRERRHIPPAWDCDFRMKQFQPMLTGCPNNDICLSWFGNILPGFGNARNEGPEMKLAREFVAHEKLEEWEDQFARVLSEEAYSSSQEARDLESADTDTDTDYGEGSNQHGNEDSYDADSENSTQENEVFNDAASDETSEVDPEDMFYGDVIDRTRDMEPKPSRAYLGPAVSIMNLFLSMMDLGRDGDFVE
ncbi:hypothetical protein FPRO05_03777 [Fusarium proliferatum]|uniref:Uncharacterized protein n=1 Tax=Gibberella intermedia TaxID=948311 RepID=A0A365MUV6_GIBIN|nr:hypothetical protein FPRO05_03777 [Fusarium proliferatum]